MCTSCAQEIARSTFLNLDALRWFGLAEGEGEGERIFDRVHSAFPLPVHPSGITCPIFRERILC